VQHLVLSLGGGNNGGLVRGWRAREGTQEAWCQAGVQGMGHSKPGARLACKGWDTVSLVPGWRASWPYQCSIWSSVWVDATT